MKKYEKGDMVPFISMFPKTGREETRCAILFEDRGGLPAGKYCFVESYCGAAGCDCRRVWLNVESGGKWLATIGFGWERKAFYREWAGSDELANEMTGVSIVVEGHHSKHDKALLGLFKESLINNEMYVKRLQRHYAMFKSALKTNKIPEGEEEEPDLLNENMADALFEKFTGKKIAAEQQGGLKGADRGRVRILSEEELDRPALSGYSEGFNSQGEGKDAQDTAGVRPPKIGRNEPCPCGSGKKYKKCCMGR